MPRCWAWPSASGDCHLRLPHAGAHGGRNRRAGRGLRSLPHRLDRAERHLHVPAHGRVRPLRRSEAELDRHHPRPSPATAADRVQLRRFLRGRGRIRHSGSGHRRTAHRAGLPAAAGFGPVADRQHRACGLRRAGYSDHRAGRSHRFQRNHPGSHGRTHPAGVLSPRSLLADLGLRGLFRNAGDLAGHSGRRRFLRHTAVFDLQLPRSVAGGRGRRAGFDGVPHRLPDDLASQAGLDLRGRRGQDRAPRRPRLQPRRSHARLGAVDHSQRHRFLLGHADRQEHHEHAGKDLHLDGELAARRPARSPIRSSRSTA